MFINQRSTTSPVAADGDLRARISAKFNQIIFHGFQKPKKVFCISCKTLPRLSADKFLESHQTLRMGSINLKTPQLLQIFWVVITQPGRGYVASHRSRLDPKCSDFEISRKIHRMSSVCVGGKFGRLSQLSCLPLSFGDIKKFNIPYLMERNITA